MDLILIKTLNGLTTGVLYAMTAFGLTFILGMLNIPNFAHGALFALGAYVGFSVLGATGSFWAALVVAPLIVALFGAALERGLIQRLYGDDPDNENYTLLVLFAVAIIMQEVIILIWGATGQSAMPPQALLGAAQLGPIYFPKYRLFILGFTLLVIGACWLFIERTRYGALIKAAIDKREMVMLLGYDIRVLFVVSFALGAGLAGLAGALSLPIRGVQPFIGMDILALSFVIVVVGGLGNLYGAIFAGILIGLIQEFATLVHPLAPWIFVYGAMMLVLLVRPTGLFGTR
ncbi:MAG TPA: branched-chain amino acid ABC transporter permease [Paracoccaceae bacterium]|nr:branched-chain amino acid ABC transporter permease [Paracoccaceae bacterium]